MTPNEETTKIEIVPLSGTISLSYTVSCLICGDDVEIRDVLAFYKSCVCDKCKKAVMEMRKNMEKEKG